MTGFSLSGRAIMITGGTGSFGKAFVKTMLERHPDVRRIVVFSRDELKQSEIRSMTRRAVETGGVNLSQGLCDLPTPDPVKQAACRAIVQDNNIYAPMNGLPGRELTRRAA